MSDHHRRNHSVSESDSSEEGCCKGQDESYYTSSLPSGAVPIKEECCDDSYQVRYGHTTYSGSKKGKKKLSGINVKVMVSPLTNLVTVDSSDAECDRNRVGIVIRKRNQTITFSWEAFQGHLAGNGVTYLTLNQTFSHLPFTKMQYPIRIKHNGNAKLGYLEIDPKSAEQIKIFISFDDPKCETKMGDCIFVAGSCVQWITCQDH